MKQESYETKYVEENSRIKDLAKVSVPIGSGAISYVLTDYLSNNLTLIVVIPSLVIIIYLLIWLITEINKGARRYESIEKLNRRVLTNNERLSLSLDEFQEFQEYLKKRESKELRLGETEIYLSYNHLNLSLFQEIIQLYDRLYQRFYFLSQGREFNIGKSHNYPTDIFKFYPDDALVIQSVHTGESIKLKISPRWIPHFSHDDDHFYIHVHKGVYLSIFTAAVVLTSLKFAVDISNGVIDLYKKLNDDKKKKDKTEIQYNPRFNQINIEIKNTFNLMDERLKELPIELREEINNDLLRLRDITINNDAIKEIKISESPLLDSAANKQ